MSQLATNADTTNAAAPAGPDVLTRRKTKPILLPWQQAWRNDASPLKIWEKSRRIGATYTEANDAVMARLTGKRTVPYWFSSADESAAAEFAEYCAYWLRVAEAVVERYTEQVEDEETRRKATAYVVRVAGTKVTAMTSNPRRFRSKGGDVGLDEFAYHDDPQAMYRAAEPATMWGGQLRILSTHNGEASEFNRLCQMGRRVAAGQAKPGDIPFSLHRITIVQAVEQGLVERINETQGTTYTRERFLAERRSRCRDEDHWQQEYMAVPAVDSAAWLPYELIEACEHADAGRADLTGTGLLYVGADIGETGHPTVIVVGERIGDVLWVRRVRRSVGEPLAAVEAAVMGLLAQPRCVRGCIDATGVGAQIAQAAVRGGKGQGVKFSLPVKDSLASRVRRAFEDRAVRVPMGGKTREDLHSIRMTRTASGGMRFDAASTADGHGDEFWALALMLEAATTGAEPWAMVG
jgi:phage FluMu gp28-like protein